MSDEDERQPSLNSGSHHAPNNRRLLAIKLKLQELTREKTKYNVDKLSQDREFLKSGIDNIRQAIGSINNDINIQTQTKRILNAEMTNLQSHIGLRSTNLEIALREKERYEKELEKADKIKEYRDLAQQQIKLIVEALPQLQKLDDYKARLKAADDAQEAARKKRGNLETTLNTKLRKQAEIEQLSADSEIKIPEIEKAIDKLRSERDEILSSFGGKKPRRRRRFDTLQQKPIDSPDQSSVSLEQHTFEYEQRHYTEQLEKIHLLRNYLQEKMSKHHLPIDETPSAELTSPLYHPMISLEEPTNISPNINEQVNPANLSSKPTITIAMRLPRNFAPLDLQSTINTEIIRSPHYPDTSIHYKKELPSDIVNKYAGLTKKMKQQAHQQQLFLHGKRNKKHNKNFGIKYSSQMISLYDDVRTSSGNCDTLPSMPMYEYQLSPTIKALDLIEQSVQSYLNELSKRYENVLSISSHDDVHENDSIRDSAFDTHSETSSLIESINPSKDLLVINQQLMVRPEQRSSSSSDEKKTIVSSSPSSSLHSHSKVDHPSSSIDLLTTVEESTCLCPLTYQIAQIERQTSDEGYRSVRNGNQQSIGTEQTAPILTRSTSYDSTGKVDQWLLSTTTTSIQSNTTEVLQLTDNNKLQDFQATDIDNDEDESS